jgi:hypothetical protein
MSRGDQGLRRHARAGEQGPPDDSELVGFEPTDPYAGSSDLRSNAFNHSATSLCCVHVAAPVRDHNAARRAEEDTEESEERPPDDGRV